MSGPTGGTPEKERQERILDAVVGLLAQRGISAVSMRAVAREAGVSLGLVNYHYADKVSLVRAALHRIEEQDVALVEPDPAVPADDRLRTALRRVADPEPPHRCASRPATWPTRSRGGRPT